MNRLTITTAILAIGSAVFLYAVSYETRQLETQVSKQENRSQKLREDIAVLKAERAHLSRPARIEQEALKLGLRPVERNQITHSADKAQQRLIDSMKTD